MSREQSTCPPKCITRRKVLIAGMGTSPAVLTNAVWALAHQKKPVAWRNHWDEEAGVKEMV